MDGPQADGMGTLIVVVGPSGAGKDSVIGFARQRLARQVDVVRRAITRPSEAGGEDHASLSADAFDERQAAGQFAVSWQAHGLRYGIPIDALMRVRAGEMLIANGSRRALPQFRAVFPRLAVVNIVASREALADRLMARGRESEADILQRLQRETPEIMDDLDVTTIDNSGPLEIAGTRFADLITALLETADTTSALKAPISRQ